MGSGVTVRRRLCNAANNPLPSRPQLYYPYYNTLSLHVTSDNGYGARQGLADRPPFLKNTFYPLYNHQIYFSVEYVIVKRVDRGWGRLSAYHLIQSGSPSPPGRTRRDFSADDPTYPVFAFPCSSVRLDWARLLLFPGLTPPPLSIAQPAHCWHLSALRQRALSPSVRRTATIRCSHTQTLCVGSSSRLTHAIRYRVWSSRSHVSR